VFDGVNRRAAGLVLGEKDLFGLMDAQVVPWDQIQKIGENAVIVQDANSCQKAGNLPAMIPLMEQKELLPGAKIYTEDGTGLGHIKDVLFEDDGTIVDYEISSGLVEDTLHGTRFMPATYNLRIGADVVFVDPQAAKDLRAEPPDFQSTADAVKKQMSESFSPESIKRSTNQLQKSIDTAAGQFKKTWKGEDESQIPPENKVS
ncbi:MAG: PRC-barrel domain-containing protein, partial [Abditibacteriaceae bacterium]